MSNGRGYLLALDQGTSSTRAMLFDVKGKIIASAQCELTPLYPQDGFVEQNCEEIWQSSLRVLKEVVAKAAISVSDIISCGISNQRETTVLWDKQTGEVVHNAIVWQDRRSAAFCQTLVNHQAVVQQKTGLVIDPYFSASKIHWLLQFCEEAKRLAPLGRLAFGTIDSFLIWRFNQGRVHATDITNASRTLLFNIHECRWDPELLALFAVPASLLPEVKACDANFGSIDKDVLGRAIPITGVVGDQQAATIAQACFKPGMIKATFGTGCFLLLNTGRDVVNSSPQLLSTIAYQLQGELSYGLEGSLFNAGTAIKWLRDELGLINTAAESELLCQSIDDSGGVYMVPAFTGLGAPCWAPNARAAFFGLQLSTGKAQLVRAVVEAICYQTRQVLDCMPAQYKSAATLLRVDGGMTVNCWLLQYLAHSCLVRVEKQSLSESTAWGAAATAGLGAGIYTGLADIESLWQAQAQFDPEYSVEAYYQRWLHAQSMTQRFSEYAK